MHMLSTRMRGNQLELNCNNSKIKQQQQEKPQHNNKKINYCLVAQKLREGGREEASTIHQLSFNVCLQSELLATSPAP